MERAGGGESDWRHEKPFEAGNAFYIGRKGAVCNQ
jgi:hypothetical protein